MSELEKDRLSSSGWSSRTSALATWSRMHHEWHGEDEPVYPLTQHSIKCVAAIMKFKDYRSFPNYLSAAKDYHIRAGFPWSDALDQTARDCSRSVLRGIGPASQAVEFDVDKTVAACGGTEPLSDGGPINFGAFVALSCFHVLREIEAGSALRRHITIDYENESETWLLPVSKTDIQALGCSRSWSCICGRAHPSLCPYHVMVGHLRLLSFRFGAPGPEDSLPLFPSAAGSPPSKAAILSSLKVALTRAGQPSDRVGGHQFRVSGCRHLIRSGVPVPTVMLLARWASNIALRYAGEAPLASLSQAYRGKVSGAAAPAGEDNSTAMAALRDRVTSLEADIAARPIPYLPPSPDALRFLENITDDEATPVTDVGSLLVLNHKTLVAHHRGDVSDLDRRLSWKTPCGWSYGNSVFSFLPAPDGRTCCKTCMARRPSPLWPSVAPDSDGSDGGL